MRKIALFLLLLPLAGMSQIMKLNVGPSFSLMVAPRTAPGVSNTTDNAIIGYAGMLGIDFAESKAGFLSGNIGLIQKGRRDQITETDSNGNQTGKRTHRRTFTYWNASVLMNFKLRNDGLIPFFSVGPRVDLLMDKTELSTFDEISFGFTGGFGLTKRLDRLELGARLDYHLSFSKEPKTRAGTAMVFFGFPLGK